MEGRSGADEKAEERRAGKETSMDVKILTKLGLLMMTPEAREERLNSLITGNKISCPAVGKLINEARDAMYVLTERESEAITEQDKIRIRWMLTKVNGEKVVQRMKQNELTQWAVELVNGEWLSAADYGEIVRAIMRME